jgi:hypothetical protein
MEVGEAVAMLEASVENEDDNYCEGRTHDPAQTGPNLIDGFTGTPTPENLLENMKKHNKRDGAPQIPKLPPQRAGSAGWDIERTDPDTFPWQTHHLIPKKFLPQQPVCVWLTEKYSKDPDYQLAKDTRYSTDHSNNGYCLPFASTCYQWRVASGPSQKDAAAFMLMSRTRKQLHQGNHNVQDFDEQDEIELEQYLESIKALLRRINDSALDHTDECEHCKKGGKRKVQPLHRIVDQVDLVSLITKLKIDAGQVFVSQRAYDFHKASS